MTPEFIPVPEFAKELLLRQKCPFCKTSYQEGDVVAAGNRRAKDQKTYFFYEAQCAKCDNPTMTIMTSRPCDMYALAVYVAQMYSERIAAGNDNRPEIQIEASKLVNKQRSLISDAEIESVKRMLKDTPTHHEFLLRIGLTEEQIRLYEGEPGATDPEDDDDGE